MYWIVVKWLEVVSYRNSTSNHNCRTKLTISGQLYLIEILHQTTTDFDAVPSSCRCILSKFYIKPQLLCFPRVAIHRCILSKFYIKPQLRKMLYTFAESCILSKFYIKPQHLQAARTACKVVSYRNSTSNHNMYWIVVKWLEVVSYRNSTSNHNAEVERRNCGFRCILSKFYIKPQLVGVFIIKLFCCILSKFYIKPQHVRSPQLF